MEICDFKEYLGEQGGNVGEQPDGHVKLGLYVFVLHVVVQAGLE